MQRAIKIARLIEQIGVFLGRVAANMQQRQDQRRELVPQRQPGKHCLGAAVIGADGKAGAARVGAVETRTDFVRQHRDLFDQCACIGGFRVITQACHQFDRATQIAEIGLQLGGGGGIEHGHGGRFR